MRKIFAEMETPYPGPWGLSWGWSPQLAVEWGARMLGILSAFQFCFPASLFPLSFRAPFLCQSLRIRSRGQFFI